MRVNSALTDINHLKITLNAQMRRCAQEKPFGPFSVLLSVAGPSRNGQQMNSDTIVGALRPSDRHFVLSAAAHFECLWRLVRFPMVPYKYFNL